MINISICDMYLYMDLIQLMYYTFIIYSFPFPTHYSIFILFYLYSTYQHNYSIYQINHMDTDQNIIIQIYIKLFYILYNLVIVVETLNTYYIVIIK